MARKNDDKQSFPTWAIFLIVAVVLQVLFLAYKAWRGSRGAVVNYRNIGHGPLFNVGRRYGRTNG
jgi:hypothetical protein